jgi:hypothetical protein
LHDVIFGVAGEHFHDNRDSDELRKTVLDELLGLAKSEVPSRGVESSVTRQDLGAKARSERQSPEH